jgi:hypothetical protein
MGTGNVVGADLAGVGAETVKVEVGEVTSEMMAVVQGPWRAQDARDVRTTGVKSVVNAVIVRNMDVDVRDVDVTVRDMGVNVAVGERVAEPWKATLELMAVGTASWRVVKLATGADHVSRMQEGLEVAVEAAVNTVATRGMDANREIEERVTGPPKASVKAGVVTM